MSQHSAPAIWPLHEAFYIEAMHFNTTSALDSASNVQAALEAGALYSPDSSEWQESALAIVNGVQAIALQAGAVSRYLWPSSKKPLHLARGERLRIGLGVRDDSSLYNRDLRNALEHFDERLDAFCQNLVAGRILPTYLGPLGEEPEVPTFLFRAYYTDVGVFEVIGKRFEMTPILDAIQDLHDRLVKCSSNGGRLPDA